MKDNLSASERARRIEVLEEQLDRLAAESAGVPRLSQDKYERRTELMDELDDLRLAQFLETARIVRKSYVGKVVPLEGVLADPANPANPLAHDPYATCLESMEPYDWREWKFATVTNSGVVVKAYTQEAVTALAAAVTAVQPLMGEFGLIGEISHVFETDEKRQPADAGFLGVSLPLCEDDPLPRFLGLKVGPLGQLIYVVLHELAHVGHPGHGAGFQERLNDFVRWYLGQAESPSKASVQTLATNGLRVD
jgi:hypothetical protein